MTKRVALYARVSTDEQTVENQLIVLRSWAESQGHAVVDEYVDEGVSGAKARRPGLDRMLKAAAARKFDVIAAVALDRLGRSLPHLVTLVDDLQRMGVGLYLRNMQLDTTTPVGELLFHIMGALAQFERGLIRERTRAGIARARRQGKHIGGQFTSPYVARRVVDLLKAGTSVAETARMSGVSRMTARRIGRAAGAVSG